MRHICIRQCGYLVGGGLELQALVYQALPGTLDQGDPEDMGQGDQGGP